MRQFVGIGIGVSMLGLFAVPQIVSAATVAVTVTDSGGTAISKAFIAILNADGDSIDGVITGSDGAALVETVSSNAMIITAPGFQTKSVTGAVTAQTVVLTTTTTTKLSYANSFGAQVRTVANDGESGVMYATTDNQPSVWRTSDYAGTWSPVPTSADSTTGLPQESAGDIFTSGVPGEVAVQISNALYFSRDYGNTWSSVTGYSNATGQNKKHFWMHGGAAGETSIIFVRSDSALFAAVMPDSKTDSAPSFTQVTTLGSSFVAGDKVAFAVGTSGLLYMAAVNAANTRISTLTLKSGVLEAASFTASPTATMATAGVGFVQLSTLGTAAPKAVLMHMVDPATSTVQLTTSFYDSATWATSTGVVGTTSSENVSSWTVTGLSGNCGQIGNTPLVGSIAPVTGAGAVAGFEVVGTIGQCMFAYNATGTNALGGNNVAAQKIAVLPMPGANNNTGFVWDSGYNFTDNMVALSGDGQFGLRKAADLSVATSYRPTFGTAGGTGASAFINSQAAPGKGITSGGIAVNGMVAPNITDMAYSPNSTDGQLLVTSTTSTGGSRTLLTTDGGKSFSTIGAGGSRAVDWWNGAGGVQHIAAGFANNPSEFLHVKSFTATSGSGALDMGDELAATAALRDGTDSATKKPFSFGSSAQPASGTLGLSNFLTAGDNGSDLVAIEGIAGFNKMLVAVNKCSENTGPSGCAASAGSVGLVTFSVNGTTAATTISETRYFGASVPAAGQTTPAPAGTYAGAVKSVAYCPAGSVSRLADSAFVAVAALGVYKITGVSGSSPTQSGPVAVGTYADLKIDCDTGLMVAAGSDGLYFSVDGTKFTKVATASSTPGNQPQNPQGSTPTAVAVQADSTTGEVVMAIASGNGDIKTVEGSFSTTLGTTIAAMTGGTAVTPTATVTPPTAEIIELNSSTTGKNTGSVGDLELPNSATDKVAAASIQGASIRVAGVRKLATALSLAVGTGAGAFRARTGSAVSAPPTTTTTTTIPKATTTIPKATVVVKIPTMKKGQSLVITSIAKTIKLSLPTGAKIVVTRLTVSKAICTVYTNKVATMTTIKGLKAGSCKVTIKVTPKATTKVKKPGTSTSNVTIKVT